MKFAGEYDGIINKEKKIPNSSLAHLIVAP